MKWINGKEKKQVIKGEEEVIGRGRDERRERKW